MSQTMIETIPLPIDPSNSCRNPLKIADQVRKLAIAWNANQHV